MTIVRGRFNWVEFLTTNPTAAVDFYSHVVGWTTSEMKMPGGDTYSVFEASGRGMGGVFTVTQKEQDEGMPTGWVGYITSPDVDGDVERLKRAGGTLHRPANDIPDVGRIAPVADPQGAGFLLMHPKPPAGQEPPPLTKGPGSVGWAELITSDPKAAFAFYSEMFSWKREREVPMPDGSNYLVFSTGADPGGGIMKGADASAKPTWLYYFTVDSISAALKRVITKGGRANGEPHPVPTGDFVVPVTDSLGGRFALISKKQ